MASNPITSWQIEGENVEVVTDFLFLDSQITVDDDCSLEIRRWLLHGWKTMISLDSVLKSREITLLIKVHIVKVMVSQWSSIVVTWTIKKAEWQRSDAFELWCWRRLLKVTCTARRSNQSILREINPEYSLEGLMLKLKLQYFGHLMWTADSLEKSLMLGKIEGRRRRGHQRKRWLDDVTDAMYMNLGKFWEMIREKERAGVLVHGVAKSWTWLGNWTTTTWARAFPGGSDGKESACYAGDPGLISRSGRCPGKENGCSFQYPCLCYVSLVAQLCLTLCDPMIVALQAPLFMGFPRQEYWSRLSLPSPGIKPMSLMSPALQVDSLPTEPFWVSHRLY